MCCGGAGVYNLLEPDLSSEILKDKLAHIENRRRRAGNRKPRCHMQIGAGVTAGRNETGGSTPGRVAGCVLPQCGFL